MNNSVDVSVVVPVYNTDKYLKEAIDSIIGQSLKNIEIILIDDGSTDNSGVICDEYAKLDNRIKVFHQKNSGASKARNIGLKIAQGRYIIFLDSDDIFSLNLLENMYNRAISTEADVTICRENLFSANELPYKLKWDYNDTLIPKEKTFSAQLYNKYILNFCVLWPWDKLYKREFLLENNILFPTNRQIQGSEDLAFVAITLVLAKNITFLNEYLINHRLYNLSLGTRRDKGASTLAIDELYCLLNKYNKYKMVEQSFKNLVLNYLNWSYLDRKSQKIDIKQLVIKTFTKYKIFEQDESYYYDSNLYNYSKNYFTKKHYFSIFSITSDAKHKIITILGIRIKFKKRSNIKNSPNASDCRERERERE